MSPVHLCLLARRRLESSHRHYPRRLPLWLQPVLQNRVAARVVALPQFPQKELCVPDTGPQPLAQIRLERFQLAYRQQYRNLSCLRVFLHPLTHFQAAVARHVDVEHDQVRLVFRNFLERRRAVVDRNHVVSRIGEDTSAHILGSHAVVGKQYSSRQGISFGEGETA